MPLLAFAFSVLKGLGAYDLFVATTIAPYVQSTFGSNPFMVRAINQVLGFVARTSFSSLGVAGLVLLVYTTVRMLSSIEGALNVTFGVARGRSLYRQVMDYVTMAVVAPILVLGAVAVGSAAQSSKVVEFLRQSLRLGPVIDLGLRLTSVVVAAGTMLVLYPMWAVVSLLVFLTLRITGSKLKWKEAGATASIGSWIFFALLILIMASGREAIYAGLMAMFVAWRHKKNFRNLFGATSKPTSVAS